MHSTSALSRCFVWLVAAVALVSLSPLGALAGDDEKTEPCAGTDRATILEKDSTLRQMRSWELKGVELVSCEGPTIPLRLTWWSPESAATSSDLRYQWVYDVVYDPKTHEVAQTDPTIDARRGKADKAIRAAEKNDLVKELLGAASKKGATVDGEGTISYFVPEWGGEEPVATFTGEAVTMIEVPTSLDLSSSIQVTAFKGIAPSLVDDAACELPEAFRASIDDDGQWTFEFTHDEGPCRGDWRVVIKKDASVEYERL